MAVKRARTITRYVSRPASRRRSKSMTIPLAPLAGLAVGMLPVAQSLMAGKADSAMSSLVYAYTGWRTWDNTWSWRGLERGLLPLAVGAIVHKVIGGKLGVNRALASAGVPFIRL